MKRIALLLLVLPCGTAMAQTRPSPVTGQVSVHVDTVSRALDGGARESEAQVSTTISLRTADRDTSGAEVGLDVRQAHWIGASRDDRLSVYDAFVGARLGGETGVRVRAGHMWINDLGTVGSLAGGLVEIERGADRTKARLRIGSFAGLEPRSYRTGYVSDVRKYGGYVAFQRGYLQRHVAGYTQVRQGSMTERSVLSLTNFVPAGRSVFIYQAAEYEITGPASGAAENGLSYLLANVRVSANRRLELFGTYNRGRSLDARTITTDLLNGRTVTPLALEGLRYESAGGRVTVGPVTGVTGYVAYYRDRTNRDDQSTGRVTLGGHAANVARSGFDVSASDSRINRSGGAYHSTSLTVGRSIGRSAYASFDYSTSLSLLRFVRSDGLVIETRPSTRRLSGSGSVTLNRSLSLLFTADQTRDDALRDLRILAGVSYRIR